MVRICECGCELFLYITRKSKHKYWRCSNGLCPNVYTEDGMRIYNKDKWNPEDFNEHEKPKPRCRCGSRIVEVDNHFVCERYFLQIKKGLEETERMLKGDEEYE